MFLTQPVTDDIYWYFIISLANYSAWNFSHFWDVPRRDPKVVITHHFSAVVLLSGMWVAGAHRVGLLVCLTHDVGDILLEACKCSKYLNLLKAKAWWLWIFAFFNCGIWIFTRNIILPLHIIPSIYHYSPFNLPQTFPLSCFHGSCDVSAFKFTMCHVLLIMLVGMSILHVYWTGIMVRISYLGLIVGKMEDDTRSMSNCDNDDDEDNHEKGIKLDRTNCPV
ncbi:ceramide synthase 4-like isoform X1 [Bemisia tabaci]|uniref:ceramide synthase 4-like isoform X1 n=2 Tax=Bemisia tabaci TaxID=7038 RepID=UPI003B27CBCC